MRITILANVCLTLFYFKIGTPCSRTQVKDNLIKNVQKIDSNKFEVFWPATFSFEKGGGISVKRCVAGRLLTVAKGEIIGVSGSYSYAQVKTHVKEESVLPFEVALKMANIGNLYWLPMVGDFISVSNQDVSLIPTIQTQWVAEATQLFEDPFKDFVLNPMGRAALLKAVEEKFLGKSGNLIVEGFVNRVGPRLDNRLLAQEWSQAVAQFLRTAYDLSFDRVVSLSIGNDHFSLKQSGTNTLSQSGGVRIYLSH